MPSVTRVIAAPAATVWDFLVNVDTWPRWGLVVTDARLDAPETGLRLGSTGQVTLPFGVQLPFVITEFSAGQHWAWAVAGVSATGHRVTEVSGGSQVSFTVPLWAAPYSTVCAIALCKIGGVRIPV